MKDLSENDPQTQKPNITPEIIDIIIQENPQLLDAEIDQILSNKKPHQDTLFVSDVDECITQGHLSRTLSNGVSTITGRDHPKVPDSSLESTIMLWDNYLGTNNMQYLLMMSYAADQVPLSNDFIQISNRYLKNSNIFSVLVSSGIYDLINMSLHRNCLNYINVLASKVKFDENNSIERPGLTIGDKEKGWGVLRLIEKGQFERVISLGHSDGDKHLILSGSPGLRFCIKDERYPMVQEYSNATLNNLYEIEKYILPYTAIEKSVNDPEQALGVLKNKTLVSKDAVSIMSQLSKIKPKELYTYIQKDENGDNIKSSLFYILLDNRRLHALPKPKVTYIDNEANSDLLEDLLPILHLEYFPIKAVIQYLYDKHAKPQSILRLFV